MTAPRSLVELPPPDPDTVRMILALLAVEATPAEQPANEYGAA